MSDKSLTTEEEQEVSSPERASLWRKFIPRVDILEDTHLVKIIADVPGVDENTLEITLEKNSLTIKGRAELSQPEGFKRVYSEFPARDFERSFALPEELNQDEVEAIVRNGVLTIFLPKTAAAKTRKVSVQGREN